MTTKPITTGKGDRRIALENGYIVRRFRTSAGSRYQYRNHTGQTPRALADNMARHGEPADIVVVVRQAADRLALSARAASERNG